MHMKKFLCFLSVSLMVLAVSCKKDENKAGEPGTEGSEPTVLGFWKVESENASISGNSDLCYAWYNYYYSEFDELGIYSILFLPNNDKDNWKNYDYAYLCLPISLEGKELNLANDLIDPEDDDRDFTFYAGTKTIYIGNQAYTGTMSLNVDMSENTVIFKLDGISPDGDKVKIEYSGHATPTDTAPFYYTDFLN